MKKTLLFISVVIKIATCNSQSLGYDRLGILFSKDAYNGSSRFNAMSGAFGALGGDISSVRINPAGIAVALKSMVSVTLGSRKSTIATKYYRNSTSTEKRYFNFQQAGMIISFSGNQNSNFNRFAIAINYNLRYDFENTFLSKGNGNFARFTEFYLDKKNPKTKYNTPKEQRFLNIYDGQIIGGNFAFSGVYKHTLFFGIALNTANLTFTQKSVLSEVNNNDKGNTLTANLYQENKTTGSGFSLSFGAIYRVTHSLRLGVSYQTPMWYSQINKETNYTDKKRNEGDLELKVSTSKEIFTNFFNIEGLIYSFKTPSKLTFSGAYVFGKKGLISIDYSYKNFRNMKFNENTGDFSETNQGILKNIRGVSIMHIGTEWRIHKLSVRGGYSYEQNPLVGSLSSDNLTSFSLGLGYNFRGIKIDVAYKKSTQTDFYNIYNIKNAKSIDLDYKTSHITGTITFDL